jgi:hypothetical protein
MPRRPLPAWLTPPVGLTLIVLLASAYVLSFAFDTTRFTTEDEIWAIVGGRLLEGDLGLVTDTGIFNRGPERMISLLLAGVGAIVPGVPDEFRVLHVIIALAYFAAAFPLYALGRRLGLTPWVAVAAAALGVLGPWMVFGATFLNTSLGFPLTVALAWASHRAAMQPSLRGDALVLGIAGLNTLARTSHAAFAGAAVFAILYATWRRRPSGESAGTALVRLVPRTARAHPLIMGAAGLVVLFVLVAGPARLAGSAYDTGEPADLGFAPAELYERLVHWFSQLTLVGGFLPFVIGAAWALREIVRPQETSTGVFAVIWLGIFFLFVYITGSHNSTIEERYLAPLGGLPLLAFAVALTAGACGCRGPSSSRCWRRSRSSTRSARSPRSPPSTSSPRRRASCSRRPRCCGRARCSGSTRPSCASPSWSSPSRSPSRWPSS